MLSNEPGRPGRTNEFIFIIRLDTTSILGDFTVFDCNEIERAVTKESLGTVEKQLNVIS